MYSNSDILRCWLGYRLIFTGRQVPLDKHSLIPIFRDKKRSRREIGISERNLKILSEQLPTNMLWLYCFANSVSDVSGLPFIYGADLSKSKSNSMMKNYLSMLEFPHKNQYEKLCKYTDIELQHKRNDAGFTKIIQLLIENKISFVTLMMYHKKFPIDISFLNKSMLTHGHIFRIVNTVCWLENEYNFAEKILKSQKVHIERLETLND